ncbi:MAG: response regulator [Candidatus Margulisiibacteriota bacterium]
MNKPLVLVIDDEQKQTDMVAKLIEATGKYQAVKAYNAKEGFEVLKKSKAWLKPNRVKLILLDIKMPDMDGLQFLEEMRKQYTEEEIGVIMLTAYEDEDKWERATSGYVAGYLKKPVIEIELLAVLDRFFSNAETRSKMTIKTFERHIEKKKDFEAEKGTRP